MEDLIKQNVSIEPSSNNQNNKNQASKGQNNMKDLGGQA